MLGYLVFADYLQATNMPLSFTSFLDTKKSKSIPNQATKSILMEPTY